MRNTTVGAGAPQAATFSTVGLPAEQRLEKWESYNATALIALSCRTIDGAPLEATERNLWLPHVEVAQVHGSPHMVERTAREIDRHPTRAAVVYFAMAGAAFFYHHDGVHVLNPGQAVVCDADLPFVRGFAQGLTELVLKVPRTVFDGLSDGMSLRAPQVFDIAEAPGGGHGHALARRLRSAVAAAQATDRQVLERDALGLLRGMVSGGRAADARSQLRAAEDFIERHLTDRDLSAARIAARIGISERQLSRIFREHGGVARWITDRRLDRAREALLTGDPRASIGEIAGSCGFNSQSYFARAFKRRFGSAPRELRTFPPSG